MEQEPKSPMARSEKRVHRLIHTVFAWFYSMVLHPVASWLNAWQTRVSIKTRNFWILLVLGLFFLGGLYHLYLFISTYF